MTYILNHRHEEMGSWYVQAIVDVFSEFAVNRDIHSLLTKVNRKVSKMTTGIGGLVGFGGASGLLGSYA